MLNLKYCYERSRNGTLIYFRGGGTRLNAPRVIPDSFQKEKNCYKGIITISKGFTLAEVLITLGIIGVVAAMTLPTLIANYKDKELIEKTKKTYSNIQNAVLLAQKDSDVIGDNTILFDTTKTSAEVAENFIKYFNGAKLCKSSSDSGCKDYFYAIKYATKAGAFTPNSYPRIILNDGAVLSILQYSSCDRYDPNDCKQNADGECLTDSSGNKIPNTTHHTECAYVFFDVNGPRIPNQFGRDAYGATVFINRVQPATWAPYGGKSITNILSGKDELYFKNKD